MISSKFVIKIAEVLVISPFFISAFYKLTHLLAEQKVYTGIPLWMIALGALLEMTLCLMVVINYKPKLAMIGLILFLIGNTAAAPTKFGMDAYVLLSIWKKNISILGGLLLLFAIKTKENCET